MRYKLEFAIINSCDKLYNNKKAVDSSKISSKNRKTNQPKTKPRTTPINQQQNLSYLINGNVLSWWQS